MQYRVLALCALIGCGGGEASKTLADAPGGVDAATGDACVPSGAEVCDGVDNDCDGLVDNVDVGGDGLYDCQRVLFLGAQGARASSDFEQWAHGNGTTVQRVNDAQVTVDAALLAAYDLVLIDHVSRTFTPAEAAALAGWVAAGGGVMALSGYTGGALDKDGPNSLLGGLGVSFTGTLLSGPVTTFASDPLATGLSSVTFSGGFPVAVDPAADRAVVIGRIGALPVAAAAHHGQGRVYAWGDEWVTFDSEWAGSTEIQQFWVDAFGWLGRFR